MAKKKPQGNRKHKNNTILVKETQVSPSVRKKSVISKNKLAAPMLNQRAPEVQPYGELFPVHVGIEPDSIAASVECLNQVLAETMVIRDMYKKHHWQVSGATFYSLHLLLDEHYEKQAELTDMIAERIQSLGGISLAMPHDVAEVSTIERPPKGREEVPVQLSRLVEAHQVVLKKAREGAKEADENEDDGTNDLLVSNVIRTNEQQAWFISEHLVSLPVVMATEDEQVMSEHKEDEDEVETDNDSDDE